jgi:hypothetical protein
VQDAVDAVESSAAKRQKTAASAEAIPGEYQMVPEVGVPAAQVCAPWESCTQYQLDLLRSFRLFQKLWLPWPSWRKLNK